MAGPQPTTEKWITKPEAAALLGLSIRELERMASRGKVHKRYEAPGSGRRYGRTLYLESDVKMVREERNAGIRNSGPMPPTLTLVPAPQERAVVGGAQVDAWGVLVKHLAELSAAYPRRTAEPKLWMTLEEAVEYSGLRRPDLLELLKTKRVYATGNGPKTWRIQRTSIDAYSTKPHR